MSPIGIEAKKRIGLIGKLVLTDVNIGLQHPRLTGGSNVWNVAFRFYGHIEKVVVEIK
jgi:hypothetical protein